MPLVLMSDDSNNEVLLFFMLNSQESRSCEGEKIENFIDWDRSLENNLDDTLEKSENQPVVLISDKVPTTFEPTTLDFTTLEPTTIEATTTTTTTTTIPTTTTVFTRTTEDYSDYYSDF